MIIKSRIAEILLAWFDENRRILPWRENRTAYGTWISETMLQQTRVTTVIPYYKRFLDQFPDIATLSQAPQEEVYKAWEGLGYYSRARNLQKGAMFLVEHMGGELPADYQLLLSVPGIGPYTAGAISSLAYGLSEPAVDGNVIRVFSRLFALWIYPSEPKAKADITKRVREILPDDRAGDFNEAIMDLGATVCLPGKPSCGNCPVSLECAACLAGIQTELPLRKTKKERPVIPYTIVILKKGSCIYIRQRPQTGLLANLFEFPSYPDLLDSGQLHNRIIKDYKLHGNEIRSITPLGGSSHVFSHLKWEMTGYLVELCDPIKNSLQLLPVFEKQLEGEYISIAMAKKLAFPSALKAYTSAVFHACS